MGPLCPCPNSKKPMKKSEHSHCPYIVSSVPILAAGCVNMHWCKCLC
ncbi:unnamed protein product [Staurois parvus]|uniref:Uncharacterized protein n=1 Tax=Staurois parvus TaxID=386267 RepID=A0ABN9BWG6_9NEOB|nr:unnamed protein product [Staurois parvus]